MSSLLAQLATAENITEEIRKKVEFLETTDPLFSLAVKLLQENRFLKERLEAYEPKRCE
jgi:hypothetical protein